MSKFTDALMLVAYPVWVITEIIQGRALCLIRRHKERWITTEYRKRWSMPPNEKMCARCGWFY